MLREEPDLFYYGYCCKTGIVVFRKIIIVWASAGLKKDVVIFKVL